MDFNEKAKRVSLDSGILRLAKDSFGLAHSQP